MADDWTWSFAGGESDADLPPALVDGWSVAVALVGLSLWAQCFWSPLSTRLQAGAAEPWRVLPLVAPLLALAGSVLWRKAWLRLFAVPVSFVPGLLMVSAAEFRDDGQFAILRVAGTFAVYTVFAGLSLRRDRERRDWMNLEENGRGSEESETDHERGTERPAGMYPFYVETRVAWMVGLFVVLMWGLFGSGATDAVIAENFSEHPQEARMFLTVLMTFVWSVAVYLGALRPVSNLEYRIRRRKRSLKERPDGRAAGRRLAWRALVGLAGVVGVAMFAV